MSQNTTLEYQDGSRYCGECENTVSHGYGMLIESANKGIFEGLWVKGKQISGTYTWPNGKLYMGDWKGSIRNGLGVEARSDGTKYSGEFLHNARGLLGVLSVLDQGLYMGMWSAASGIQEGLGVEAYADGGFYRGEYRKGLRNGYGTRSSSGHERIKELGGGSSHRYKALQIQQRPSDIASAAISKSLPRFQHTHRGSADNINVKGAWSQVYEGEWVNDKRSGYGILKVSDCFTYYGQWKENTRSGYGVLMYDDGKGKKEGKVEEGLWENGKLVEPVKYKKFMRTELQMKVKDAHAEAIRAADQARDKASIAETKANAAAAKSRVAEMKAVEARKHAAAATRRVENAARTARQAVDDAWKIKGSVKILLSNTDLLSSSLDSANIRSVEEDTLSCSYLQLAAENRSRRSLKTSIPLTSSFNQIPVIPDNIAQGSSRSAATGSEYNSSFSASSSMTSDSDRE